MSKLALALAAVALLVALYAAFRPAAAPSAAPEEAGELAYHMAYLERYADKLHAAAEEGNWPLAGFYLHEIEETAETVAAERHVEDGVALAPLIETMLLPAVARAEAAGGDAPAFAAAYRGLVASCNDCHAATGHAFVRIAVPDRSAYPNQDFRPVAAAGAAE